MRARAAMILAVVVAACTSSPAATSRTYPDLSVSNGTTLTVTIVVNGTVLETIKPGGYEDPVASKLPALPWDIEARSPSGRRLASFTVSTTDYVDANTGKGARVDLSCGRLDLWSGPPMLGPAPASGTRGDCS